MSNYDLETFPSAGKRKRQPSNALTIDFTGLRIGTSLLPISESTGTLDFGSTVLTNLGTPVNSTDASTKSYVDAAIAAIGTSLEWQQSCLSRAFTPPVSPATGDRYLLDLLFGTPTGAWSGHGDQIAQWSGSTWLFTTVTTGTYVSIDNETDRQYYFGGSGWAPKFFEATTASNGLQKIGFDISVKFESTNPSLQFDGSQALGIKFDSTGGLTKNSNGTAILLNGSTLNLGASGLKVASAGITAVEINTSAIGPGLTGGGGSAIAVGAGTGIKTATGLTSVDYAMSYTNDNAGAVTLGQVVYTKTNGHVDLAIATNSGLIDAEIGIVEDASIASGGSGKIVVRRGDIASGFLALVIGKMVYISRSVAGSYTQDLSAFVSGDQVVELGRAFSATSIIYNPKWSYEY